MSRVAELCHVGQAEKQDNLPGGIYRWDLMESVRKFVDDAVESDTDLPHHFVEFLE